MTQSSPDHLSSPLPLQWFEDHRLTLERAVEVYRSREAWSPYIESPRRRFHPEGAKAQGERHFNERLDQPFRFSALHPGEDRVAPDRELRVGAERSPFTQRPLGVTYPRATPEALFEHIETAWVDWRVTTPTHRVGICLEILSRWAEVSFENAFATQHTTGQAFMLSFAGSGASALDRGLEALTAAWVAISSLPQSATYTRTFGGDVPAELSKRYFLMPVGVALVFSCGSYPAWNAYPAMMANLATGNPVILKPHPDTILPMAIMVDIGREVLKSAGFDPNLLTLAVDTWDDPIGVTLMDHPKTAIIDFTGGARFGSWIEERYPRKQVYTETAGCNPLIIESTIDLEATLDAIAQSLCLFSAQMCTAPQNIWLSQEGVRLTDVSGETIEVISCDALIESLLRHIDRYCETSGLAEGTCGALHSAETLSHAERLTKAVSTLEGASVLREGRPYVHSIYPEARVMTPLVIHVPHEDRILAQEERFGPISFILIAPDREIALRCATSDAHTHGAIASYAYTTDKIWMEHLEESFALAGASVGLNLHLQRPINFTAAFSDYHVTGLNPAGNACLTDPAFVSRRFRIVQVKRERLMCSSGSTPSPDHDRPSPRPSDHGSEDKEPER